MNSKNYFNVSTNFASQKNSIKKESSLNLSKNIFSSNYLNSSNNSNSNKNNTLLNISSVNVRSRSLINTTKLKSNTFIDSDIFSKRKILNRVDSLVLKDDQKEEEKKNYTSYLEKLKNTYLDKEKNTYIQKNEYNLEKNNKKNNLEENKKNNLENNTNNNYLRISEYKYDGAELNVQLSKTENILYNNKIKEEEKIERKKSPQNKRKDLMDGNKIIYSGYRRYTDIAGMKEKSLSRETSMSKFKYVVINGKLIKKDLTDEDINFHGKNLPKSHSSLINRTSSMSLTEKIDKRNFSKEKNNLTNQKDNKKNFVFTKNYIKFDNDKKNKFNSHINKESEDFMEFTKKNIRVVSTRDLKSYILRDKKDEVKINSEISESSKNSYTRSRNRFDSINLEDTDIIYKSKN